MSHKIDNTDWKTLAATYNDKWQLAKGSCGFNVGDTPVYGCYVNGVALFAIAPNHVVVTGQMSCHSREYAVIEALKWGVLEADERYSRKKFNAVMENQERLEMYVGYGPQD